MKQSDAHTSVESHKSDSYKCSGIQMFGFGNLKTTSAMAISNMIFQNRTIYQIFQMKQTTVFPQFT